MVKLAKECQLMLDKTFRVRVLKELRQWGQDEDAVAMVSLSLEVPEEGDRGRLDSDLCAVNFKGTCGVVGSNPPLSRGERWVEIT